MEEYIFIILAIILSIISAVNRNKKKAAGIAGKAESPDPPSFFEKMINESLFDEEPVANYQGPEIIPSGPVLRPVVPKGKKQVRQPFLSHESTVRRIRKRSSEINAVENIQKKREKKNILKKHDLMNGFSLKKAVIYSEIIRTKY